MILKVLKIIENSYHREHQEDTNSSEQMEVYSSREEIWELNSEPPIYIEWVIKDGGEEVDYYAYIQTGEDGDISTLKELTWWETSSKN